MCAFIENTAIIYFSISLLELPLYATFWLVLGAATCGRWQYHCYYCNHEAWKHLSQWVSR